MAKRVIYKTSDGKRVPSVTTIINRFKDSGGLIYWANQQGLDGLTLEEARQPLATAGTVAHEMVELWLQGNDPNGATAQVRDADVVAGATRAFENFLRWKEQNKLEFEHTEVSLVSNTHRFGGRDDAITKEVDGRLSITDFKTGKLYADHILQVAAYKILWEENYPSHPLEGGAHLLSFKRETGDFAHHYFDDLSTEEEVFLDMRRLYDRVKAVEKRAR